MNRKNQPIAVPIPDEVRGILEALAAEREAAQPEPRRRVYMSDVVREAIEEYLQRRGFDVKVEVDRGGDRRSKDE